jgi:hypothetical protein
VVRQDAAENANGFSVIKRYTASGLSTLLPVHASASGGALNNIGAGAAVNNNL